jgi:hypothetical protein
MTNREIDIRHFVFLLTADCTENQLGYKMAKWINRIEVVNTALSTSARDKAVGGTMCSIIIRWMLGFERRELPV